MGLAFDVTNALGETVVLGLNRRTFANTSFTRDQQADILRRAQQRGITTVSQFDDLRKERARILFPTRTRFNEGRIRRSTGMTFRVGPNAFIAQAEADIRSFQDAAVTRDVQTQVNRIRASQRRGGQQTIDVVGIEQNVRRVRGLTPGTAGVISRPTDPLQVRRREEDRIFRLMGIVPTEGRQQAEATVRTQEIQQAQRLTTSTPRVQQAGTNAPPPTSAFASELKGVGSGLKLAGLAVLAFLIVRKVAK